MEQQAMNTTHSAQETSTAITLEHGGLRERFTSARRQEGDELALFDAFRDAKDTTVAQLVFGGLGFEAAARARMGGPDWPMLWLQGDVCPGTRVMGAQAFALEGTPIRRVTLDGRVVGSAWSDADADYCLLAGILPADLGAGRGAQTLSSFEQMEAALGTIGMDFSQVVRTWFYLDQLLDWYDEFNVVRTAFFNARGVFDRLIPASTGIGAANAAGAALAAGVLAIRPKHDRVRIQEVDSPLQNPATEYRSSFSRAVEVAFPDHRLLTISGSASIAPNGRTLHEGDVVRQIHLTLDVVENILKSRGMDWSHAARAVGYFFDLADLPTFDAICLERGMPTLPMAPAHAIVCRGDLLFELELDAVVFTPAPDQA
jgi:enamine deaminase RidA (YjgF/YER057c/UK114 family)